jgi:hypothetical protein
LAGLAVNLTEAHPIVSLHFGELADAAVQVASIRPAFSQHLFRRPQQQLTHPGNGIIITSSITNEAIDELALAVGDDAIGAYGAWRSRQSEIRPFRVSTKASYQIVGPDAGREPLAHRSAI